MTVTVYDWAEYLVSSSPNLRARKQTRPSLFFLLKKLLFPEQVRMSSLSRAASERALATTPRSGLTRAKSMPSQPEYTPPRQQITRVDSVSASEKAAAYAAKKKAAMERAAELRAENNTKR